jgi:hypothetical protein
MLRVSSSVCFRKRPRILQPPPVRLLYMQHSGREMWSKFALNWNVTLAKRPQEVISTFLAVQSTSWLVLYSALAASAVVFPPALAAGWMCARLTKKFRQPLNIALAAGLVRLVPALCEIKVSPLVTGIAADSHTMKELMEQKEKLEKNVPILKPAILSVSLGAAWLQGPVDKYGLAYYLSSKASFLLTMGATSVMIKQGIDIESIVANFGISEGVGEAVGTLAGASAANALFTPLHFYSVIYGIRMMENTARQLRLHVPEEVYEGYREQRMKKRMEREGGDASSGRSDNSWEQEKEQMENGVVRMIGLLLLFYSFGVSMYALRLMGQTANKEKEESEQDTVKQQHTL